MGKTVLIRGGSIAAGYGVEKGYADFLKDSCREKGYELINRSRFQENSFDGIWTFPEDIQPFEPGVLLIHFGVDDAFFPVYRSEFKENLVCMVRRSRELFSPAILILTSHTFDDRYDMEAVNIFYRAAREVAVDLECSLVPVHTYWAGYMEDNGLTNRDLVLSDTRYPNEHGHRVIAEAVRLRLERYL